MITLASAGDITKIKIDTLRPKFREKASQWLEKCRAAGIRPYVYEGFRSRERQAELYAKGRTTPGKIVTNAEPGQSYHNWGLAFDWVPLTSELKALGFYEAAWNDKKSYALGNKIGESLGLRALTWELPHLQDADYATWQEIPKEESNESY